MYLNRVGVQVFVPAMRPTGDAACCIHALCLSVSASSNSYLLDGLLFHADGARSPLSLARILFSARSSIFLSLFVFMTRDQAIFSSIREIAARYGKLLPRTTGIIAFRKIFSPRVRGGTNQPWGKLFIIFYGRRSAAVIEINNYTGFSGGC